MKYVSIDVETTGLDPTKHQILEIAAVYDDLYGNTNENKFHYIILHNEIVGSIEGIHMNRDIINLIVERKKHLSKLACYNVKDDTQFCDIQDIARRFNLWLTEVGHSPNSPVTFAGKNYPSFDRLFLEQVPLWPFFVRRHYRSLDPTTLFLRPEDSVPPSLHECAKRANIEVSREHRALDDAMLVVKLLKSCYRGV